MPMGGREMPSLVLTVIWAMAASRSPNRWPWGGGGQTGGRGSDRRVGLRQAGGHTATATDTLLGLTISNSVLASGIALSKSSMALFRLPRCTCNPRGYKAECMTASPTSIVPRVS